MAAKLLIPNIKDLAKRYESGVSLKHLQDETGISRGALAAHMTALGVRLRGQSEAERMKWAALRGDRKAVERQCASAWAASRGVPKSLATKRKAALTHAARLTRRGLFEDSLASELAHRGFPVSQQAPVAQYNVDVLVRDPGPIAIELSAGTGDAQRRARTVERMEQLLGRGFVVIIGHVMRAYRGPDPVGAIADYVVSIAKRLRGGEALQGKYGVIRGNGKIGPPLDRQLYQFPRIP